MTGYVKHRTFTDGDHFDTPATWEDADILAGKRVDRRRAYCIIRGTLCELSVCTHTCSGCNEQGCSECGYHGKRRDARWWPHSTAEMMRKEGF